MTAAVTNVFAPVLDQVAARIAGIEPCWRTDPQRWAYCLREAVGVLNPDWVITHFDPHVEADAVAAQVSVAEAVVDVDLLDTPALAAALELTRVLAGLYPARPVVASVTGPGALTRLIADRLAVPVDETSDLMVDVGDLLSALVAGYVTAGADRIVIWESPGRGADGRDDLLAAHGPILRRLETMAVPAVLCGGSGLEQLGYAHHVVPGRGLVCAAQLGSEPFLPLWRKITDGYDGPILSDGPIPRDCDLTLLATATSR